ncbi:BCCT family transporter [Escherichia coli]|uniref:BCCT family transporter n=1 Tax=Escherichia coli TaxID=562 RepID=UPI0020C82445|nr:BCCT family transporter [Escherichia coli]MCP8755538.1 BCCT family transporter [Escherichia coli]
MFWALLMGVVAIALLIAGGLSALQTVTIASACPSRSLLISIYGLLKALRRDLTKRESLSMATIVLRLHVTQFPGREYAISRICRSALL